MAHVTHIQLITSVKDEMVDKDNNSGVDSQHARNTSSLLHSSFRENRRNSALADLAKRFDDGGCCGKKPTLTLADLEACGLTPVPTVFAASIGQIIPRSGWRAMCVYVYETLFRTPFPAKEHMSDGKEWGTIVATEIRENL